MTFVSAFDDKTIRLDADLVKSHLDEQAIADLRPEVDAAVETLHSRSGAGSDYLGWLDPATIIPDDELVVLKNVARQLKSETQELVVIGIGGSYLGTRACHDALQSPGEPCCLNYAGINMSGHYHLHLLSKLEAKNFGINIISKSGTTTEPGIAFRIFRKTLEDEVGKEIASRRIVATTDKSKGALRELAVKEDWQTFIVPDDVGGRFSVLTPVGLFPLAYAGVDIDAILAGATETAVACSEKSYERNPARLYAAIRFLLYRKRIPVEALVTFEPRLEQFIEWWKQLTGESEGKDRSGLMPSSAIFSRDLHSIGQWIQDGPRILFESFLSVERGEPDLHVPDTGDSADELGYLAGRKIFDINKTAEQATRIAHAEGGCPNLGIYLNKIDPYHLGALIYFFEYAIAITGYLAKINPFNQPGVEVYKKKMFELLGKPGFKS
jgi:glucose-6-phosphate isomerase